MIDNEALQSLEKLHQLKESGVITEADFEKAKEKVLGGAPAGTVAREVKRPTLPANPDAGPSHKLGDKFDGTLPPDDNVFAWMILPLRRYADFDGRSSRKEFWMFVLLHMIVTFAAIVVVAADSGPFGLTGTVGNLALLLLVVGYFGTFVPTLAVQARRFHDQNKSGWFTLLNIIPYIGVFIVLGFMLVGSDEEENRFGPAPR